MKGRTPKRVSPHVEEFFPRFRIFLITKTFHISLLVKRVKGNLLNPEPCFEGCFALFHGAFSSIPEWLL